MSRGDWPSLGVEACTAYQLDVSDSIRLLETLERIEPDAIIHTAAQGGVDTVEGKSDQYRQLNVGVSGLLAAFSRARGIQYVFVSSNAVFGDEGRIYRDNSPHSPVNDYGRLKSEAEDAVMSTNLEALIVRPILMFGWPYTGRRLNPVVGWIKSLTAGRPISVVERMCVRSRWRLGTVLTRSGVGFQRTRLGQSRSGVECA
jgi:dTDP-4-dehydrorhamnose reductase